MKTTIEEGMNLLTGARGKTREGTARRTWGGATTGVAKGRRSWRWRRR
jgi:hypothetical protein